MLQLDYPEQSVTKAGELAGNEPGELGLAAVPEDPAVNPIGGEENEERGATDKDCQPDGWGGIDHPVEAENQQVGKKEPKESGQNGLRHLDAPEAATEGV